MGHQALSPSNLSVGFNWEEITGITNEKLEVVLTCLASSLSLFVAHCQHYAGKQKSL